MTFREILDKMMSAIPGPKGGTMQDKAAMFLRSRQLEATSMNHKGWKFLMRQGYARNDGGYKTGSFAVTQDSRTITLTGGTLPTTCAGWRIGFAGTEKEQYTIQTRSSDSVGLLDRPYEGETSTALTYRMWDPYLRAPSDLDSWKSVTIEREGKRIYYEDLGFVRGSWPAPVAFGSAELMTLGEPSDVAGYETGTVTITKGSTGVTLATGEWPDWCINRHLRFQGETALYRISARGSAVSATLDRAYGGMWGGSGKSYALDPAGAYQMEIMPPQEDQYAVKIDYFREPQELVNDSDKPEGPEAFHRAIMHLATSDLMMDQLDYASMTPEDAQRWQVKIAGQERLGRGLLTALLTGEPMPTGHAAWKNVKYM